MKCQHVQEAIWCGELTHEMQTHIATCPECQREQRRVHQMGFSLKNVQVPSQSRSLAPTKREIESAMRTRRRRHLTKWATGWLATAACILLSVFTIPHWLPAKNTATPVALQPHPQRAPILPSLQDTYTTKGKQGADNNQATATNAPTPGPSTGPTQTMPAQNSGQPTTTAPSTDSPMVTIDPNADPQYQQEEDSIRAYLSKVSPANIFKHFTIQNFVLDASNSDTQNIVGTVTLIVQHQPGQGSAYGSGDQPFTVQRFAHFTLQQGLWTLDSSGLTTSPYFLNATGTSTADWRQINTTHYSLKVPPNVEAITNQNGWTTTFLNQGKVMGSLEPEGVKDHAPGDAFNAVFLPNHAEVISKRQMDSGIANLYIVQYDFKYTPPAADPSAPTTTGTRTYFIDDTNHNVYDLSFSDGALDTATLQGIIQSFTIHK